MVRLSDGQIIFAPSHLWDSPSTLYRKWCIAVFSALTWGWPGCDPALWRGEQQKQSVEFEERLQYAAGASPVNVEPKQLRICSVLFMVIFWDNQTQIHHSRLKFHLQCQQTKPHGLFTTFSPSFVHTHVVATAPSPNTHTHMRKSTQTHTYSKPSAVWKLSRIEIVQVENGLRCNQWKRRGRFN